MIFADRRDAGNELARALARQRVAPDLVVGLARGGVKVARCVAERAGAPLGVASVSVMRAPDGSLQLLGAAASNGAVWVDTRAVRAARLGSAEVAQEAHVAAARARWLHRHLGPAGRMPMRGREVLLVDEGLAWPGRAILAARWARRHGAARVVLAVPMATPDAVEHLLHEVDCVSTLVLDGSLTSHELAYRRLEPVDLSEVVEIARELHATRRGRALTNVRRSFAPARRGPLEMAC